MYYVMRLYSGQSDRSPEEFDKLVGTELAPRLKVGGGLIRYSTFVTDEGRIGSRSVYQNKEAAQQGIQIAKALASSTPAMQQMQLDTSYEGELSEAIDGPAANETAVCAIARIYETKATADQIVAAIREQIQTNAAQGTDAGRHRTSVVQLGPNRVGAFTSYVSESAAQAHSKRIQDTRSAGTAAIAKLTPNEPTIISIRSMSEHVAS